MTEIFVVVVDGKGLRRLTSNRGATSPTFLSSQGSPAASYRLCRVDANGKNRVLLTPDRESVSGLSWAPR